MHKLPRRLSSAGLTFYCVCIKICKKKGGAEMVQFHVYPGGKRRIVTFSYDDGNPKDARLIELFNAYWVIATNCEPKKIGPIWSKFSS